MTINDDVCRYIYMRGKIAILLSLLTMLTVLSCSTKKNTAMTRRVQAFKARYNTYFNAHQAYLDGIEAQRNGNVDNCTELIPLFMTGNKNTVAMGKSNFDTTIEKCQKTIKQHSITARPEAKKGNKRKTQKEKIWQSQKEYNPFLYKAWFLLGEAQFHKGEYMEAAATFSYIQRIYFSKPNIIARARILEAKCYAELKWYYDAEDLLLRAQRDSMPTKLIPIRDAILADCQIGEKQYKEAIPNLKNAIKKAQGNYQKARMYFLLGQLYHAVGDNEQAFKAFKKVPGKNPPYELAFNARIKMTEVMSQGQSKKMIHRLKSMAKNPKNKDYLDQVYYAIGNIYLANKDTIHAIWAYKDGVEKSTRSGVNKGVVWLHLGQLYWEKEEFVKAKECYSGALGLFDKEREDYKAVDERTKILEELFPHASAIELQDSLQTLAKMDSTKRMEVIKKIIEEVKKKEKEEAKKAAAAANPTNNANKNTMNNTAATNGRNNQQGGVWYFYNPTAVAAGKTEFQKKWGQRELADDWRRSNKTVLANDEEEQEDADVEEGKDDEGAEGEGGTDNKKDVEGEASEEDEGLTEKEKEEKKKQEEYANDPHRPEYYLKDIPFTDEQMAASNATLVEGLYNAAVIYKDRMENFPLAEKTFQRVLTDFPEYEHTDEIYYNLFQLYSRQENYTEAAYYKGLLLEQFPDNEHGKLIADPRFEFKGKYGKEIEDSLYQNAYEYFKANDFENVIGLSQFAGEEYPNGENRARFMFLEAMSQLEMGNKTEFLDLLKTIVDKYPKSTVSELSGLYVKGVKEGRILASGKMEMGSVWDRRASYLLESDSTLTDTVFTDKRDDIHIFLVAYEHNTINENQLLYEIAKYNFMNFPVRNFDINIELGEGIDMLSVRPFLNFDEAFVYLRKLQNDEEMAFKLEGLKYFIVSDHNLKLINRGLSFNDYFEFYDMTYTHPEDGEKPEPDDNLLNEPADLKAEVEGENDENTETEKPEGDDAGQEEGDDEESQTNPFLQDDGPGQYLNDIDEEENQPEEYMAPLDDEEIPEEEIDAPDYEEIPEKEIVTPDENVVPDDEEVPEEEVDAPDDEEVPEEEVDAPDDEDEIDVPGVEEVPYEEIVTPDEDIVPDEEVEEEPADAQPVDNDDEPWDGNIEDFDDDDGNSGYYEDVDDSGETDEDEDTDETDETDDWDDDEDEDYIF